VMGDPSVEKYPPRIEGDEADRRPSSDDDGEDDAAPPPQIAMRHDAPGRSNAVLRLTVSPDDASVYVDGRFYGTAREAGHLYLSPGSHRVEVVRPGYRTFEKDVEVSADGTTGLDVSLER
jgi:hypothetical protein